MKSLFKISVGAIAVMSVAAIGQSTRKVPYWVSIKSEEARMRTGPSTEYPIKWVYRRQGLPLKVVAVHESWRKVQDPDGDQGWIFQNLLITTKTALVTGSGNSALRESPVSTARIVWRVEPGVVGRVSDCDKGWCRLDVKGRQGFIEADRLYGDGQP